MNTASAQRTRLAGLLLTLLLLPLAAAAQTGTLVGTVVEGGTGEAVIGANVRVQTTALGAVTDLDGHYAVRGLAPGTYALTFTYLGFADKTITGVVVGAGATVRVDVTMQEDDEALDEIVVDASAAEVTNSAAGLLRLQARAAQISDGISAQQIRRSPDANSGDALRRVTGVSIFGGKFLYVRGIPERYNSVLLNGAAVTSTEPDRRAFAFDMIPSNLLDNVVILKAATPDLPGDFSGGLVRLTTVEFPDQLMASASLGSSYNDKTTFRSFLTYHGGRYDFLGFDDGQRKLPGSFPANLNRVPDRAQVNAAAQTLNNTWTPNPKTARPDQQFAFSLGNSFGQGKRFGYIGSITYRNSQNQGRLLRREFEDDGTPRFDLSGVRNLYATLWGGVLNLAYRPTRNHRFSFKNTFSATADDEVVQLGGQRELTEERQTILRFTSRGMYTGQVSGEHYFPAGRRGTDVQWSAYSTHAFRDEPDYRRLVYVRGLDDPTAPFYAAIGNQATLGGGGRYFGNLGERVYGGFANVARPFGSVRLTGGVSAEDRARDFTSRLIGAVSNASGNGATDFRLYTLAPDSVFAPENFRRGGFSLGEYAVGTNNYSALQRTLAGYLMFDAPFQVGGQRLRAVGGLRAENGLQRLNTQSLDFTQDLRYTLDKTDLFPSLNLTWFTGTGVNVRLAASRTANRPELRELAPYGYYDYNTQTTIYGNPNLRRAIVQNVDARVEAYPAAGEVLSASVFYKRFRDAIEQVVVAGISLGAERTYQNADRAESYGFELEARKGLGFLGRAFAPFSASANYTWIHSEVNVLGSEYSEARTGRPLQGQSPYMVNAGLAYAAPRLGTSVNVLYNRLGSRIFEVSAASQADITEAPRDALDLTIAQPFGRGYELRLAIRDLLQQDQKYFEGERLSRLDERARTVSVTASYRF